MYGIVVIIEFFFTQYFGNFDFIWQCGIAVSSSLAFCGFSSFWLMVFRKRSFTVLWHYSFALWLLSNPDKYFLDYLRKITTQFLTLIYNNEIGRAIPHPITGLFDHWLYQSIQGLLMLSRIGWVWLLVHISVQGMRHGYSLDTWIQWPILNAVSGCRRSSTWHDFLFPINLSSLVGVRLDIIQSTDVKVHYGFPGNRLPCW